MEDFTPIEYYEEAGEFREPPAPKSSRRIMKEALIRCFLNTFIGCGKTLSIMHLAEENARKGKSVAVVVPDVMHVRLYKSRHKEIDFIPMKHVMDILKQYSLDCHNVTNCRDLNYRGKKYDWVHIDPSCYERIILDLLKEN